MTKTMSKIEFVEFFKSLNRIEKFDKSTFVNTNTKARFIDPDFGDFWVEPSRILAKTTRGHRRRGCLQAIALKKEKYGTARLGSGVPKTSVSEVERRIQQHSPYVSLVKETYIDTNTKCSFIDSEFNEEGTFEAYPYNLMNGHSKGHPKRKGIRAVATKIAKYGKAKIGGGKKRLPVEEVETRIQKHNPDITIIRETYISTHVKCSFMDAKYGIFEAIPDNLLNGHTKGNILGQTDRAIATFQEKYGVNNPMELQEFQDKASDTLFGNFGVRKPMHSPLLRERQGDAVFKSFGVRNPNQDPTVALKIAKAMNFAYAIPYWEDGTELICVGSYEASVVCWFNDQQKKFNFQEKTFLMPELETSYRPDFYLPEEDLWIETKGYKRVDAMAKWELFHSQYPNSELWDQKKLFELGILNKNGRSLFKKRIEAFRIEKT
jgi:hypothetical protein